MEEPESNSRESWIASAAELIMKVRELTCGNPISPLEAFSKRCSHLNGVPLELCNSSLLCYRSDGRRVAESSRRNDSLADRWHHFDLTSWRACGISPAKSGAFSFHLWAERISGVPMALSAGQPPRWQKLNFLLCTDWQWERMRAARNFKLINPFRARNFEITCSRSVATGTGEDTTVLPHQ